MQVFTTRCVELQQAWAEKLRDLDELTIGEVRRFVLSSGVYVPTVPAAWTASPSVIVDLSEIGQGLLKALWTEHGRGETLRRFTHSQLARKVV